MSDDDRLSQIVAQTREELIEIKAGQRRLEEIVDGSTTRIAADVKDLRERIEELSKCVATHSDHERRLVRIESSLIKVVMTVILSFVGALVALVIKTK